jgi:MoxR-like ATPase
LHIAQWPLKLLIYNHYSFTHHEERMADHPQASLLGAQESSGMTYAVSELDAYTADDLKAIIDHVMAQMQTVILGKTQQLRLAFACLLARGHLLIEDLPGLGKTMLAHVLARSLGLGFSRIQFTSDMLPADILGVSVYDTPSGVFKFHPGPIFHHVVLADEINRATPKAQSALLEGMEERQITIEGETHLLPQPFFVIATQNPHHLVGTFPLPESQLDRFLLRIEMGYPDRQAERILLLSGDRRDLLEQLKPAIEHKQLLAIQQRVPELHLSAPLLDYVQALLDFTRQRSEYPHGLSPRAGLALVRSAQAWALMQGRTYVVPEDIQAVIGGVAAHRLRVDDASSSGQFDPVQHLIDSVAIP